MLQVVFGLGLVWLLFNSKAQSATSCSDEPDCIEKLFCMPCPNVLIRIDDQKEEILRRAGSTRSRNAPQKLGLVWEEITDIVDHETVSMVQKYTRPRRNARMATDK
tara:strand:+ start:217 stop:534 length:318 start_codon:yes stop_codon:yes gene_type:complete